MIIIIIALIIIIIIKTGYSIIFWIYPLKHTAEKKKKKKKDIQTKTSYGKNKRNLRLRTIWSI